MVVPRFKSSATLCKELTGKPPCHARQMRFLKISMFSSNYFSVDLLLLKPLFSLDNLQLHCFLGLGTLFCWANHVAR